MKTKRLTIVIISLVILATIGYIGFKFATQYGKQRVEVLVMPVAAQLSIENGLSFDGSKTVYLEPGDYTITATRDGFLGTDTDFTVGDSDRIVTVVLQPISQAAIDEANSERNQKQALDIEARAGQQAVADGQALLDQNRIIEVLPYKNLLYQIGYRADPDDSNSIIVVIDTYQGYRNLAVKQIRDLGFDPTHLKIEFGNGFESPFIRSES